MLTEIILKDYTTFINKTIFDFTATNYKILEETNVGKNRVLKGALFIGENASGKTQVLQSIVLLLDVLLENAEHSYIIKKSMYTPGTKYSIEYKFNVDGNEIKYNIGFDANNIDFEKLFLNDELKIERMKKNGRKYFTDDMGGLDINDINPTLSVIRMEYYNTRFNNNKILNKWFDFLKNSLFINCLFGVIKSYNVQNISEQVIMNYAEKNDAIELNKLMNKFGYNSEIEFNKHATNKDKTMSIDVDKETIFVKKKGTDFAMPLDLESTGNKSFINSILPIKYATTHDCMLIIDEFSSGMHNELEEALIRYFFNNSKNSQLFFCSHSTNLLDNSILRPDQIFSFRFDSKKGTLIKRISDENPRESQNIEKMYLSGVFDGMPNYNKEFKD